MKLTRTFNIDRQLTLRRILPKICQKIYLIKSDQEYLKDLDIFFIHQRSCQKFMKNLTRDSLGMIGIIRCKYAETHTQSCRAPHKNFAIDKVIKTRLHQESVLSFTPEILQTKFLMNLSWISIYLPRNMPNIFLPKISNKNRQGSFLEPTKI